METEGSLPYSQAPGIFLCPELDKSIPCLPVQLHEDTF